MNTQQISSQPDRRAVRRQQRGFTLIETVVSLAIAGIALALVTPGFIMQAQMNTMAERRSQALEATQRVIDGLRVNTPSTLPSSGSNAQTITIDGMPFSVTTSYCVVSSYCSTVTRHLRFVTTFRGARLYETETVFTELR